MQRRVCFQGDQRCAAMDELYLDNIDEYVNDQNKIVTYKWLSLTLGVHVNTAKQMLYHYIEQRRKERSGNTLHATYLVSGKCLENGNMCHKVSVVREDKLEDVKSKLDVTISVHVYSVQKAELKDSAPLYSTDYDAMKENLKNCNKYSAIRCAAAVPISTAELQRAQEMVMSTATDKEANKPVVNNYTAPASKPTSKQPKGIMGMFANKAAPKSEEQSREVKMEQADDPSPAEGQKTKLSSKASAMNNFFGKSADKKLDKADKNVKEKADGGPTSSLAGSTKQSCSSSKPKQNIKEELPKVDEVIKDDAKETRSKTKRLEHLHSEDERVEIQKKKRRRIKDSQPDSSDDEVIPDSPPAPELQIPSPEKHVKKEPVLHSSEGRRRKRRRVLKSRTFMDDEGCIVTEKGYESESYSESEDESKAQPSEDSSSVKQPLSRLDEEKKVKEKSQKKAPSATNKTTKQASITGFFQKK
ncbi:DNA polymerase delta subunit 3 isoform X1 [Ictalurus punctatus]|uniref:DNA polymerase delta subunit 3 n=2 Tax=Ictalurus punctatus TaxID=7998 RepID=A0A2D0T3B1_ICTPU|nr:DNA polymerase delta subunit 3 isoform X1 [Ictalurus punctatus]